MRTLRVWSLVCLLCLILSSTTIFAQQEAEASSAAESGAVPRLIRFSGSADAAGRPGQVVGITFSLYAEAEGGAPLWTETQNVRIDRQGRYNVLLGGGSVDGVPEELFSGSEARWLEVEIQGQAAQRRTLLVSVPYAMKAAFATSAETLAGQPAAAYVTKEELQNGQMVLASGNIVPLATSGTAGKIGKFTNATDLGDSSITEFSGTASCTVGSPCIGIGIDTPERTLHVKGASGALLFDAGNLASNPVLFFAHDNFASKFRNRIMLDRTNESMQIWSQNGPRLFVVGDKVGINVAAPTQTLDVSGAVRAAGGIVFGDGTSLTSAAGPVGVGDVSSVGSGDGLAGGAAGGDITLSVDSTVARRNAVNAFTGDQSITGGLTVSGNVAGAAFSGTSFTSSGAAATGVTAVGSQKGLVATGVARGIEVTASDPLGFGVFATATIGVGGFSANTTGPAVGVGGQVLSDGAGGSTYGVTGLYTHASGTGIGGYFESSSPNGPALVANNTAAGPVFRAQNNGTNFFTINPANVGIGVAPSTARTVDIDRSGTDNSSSWALRAVNQTTNDSSSPTRTAIRAQTSGASVWDSIAGEFYNSSTSTSGGAWKYGLWVDVTGNTGGNAFGAYISNTAFNTNNDSIEKYGLQVFSTGNYTGLGGTANVNTGIEVTVSGADVNYAAVLNGGNVGINTSSPDDRLQVVGDIRVGTSGTNGCVKRFDGTALTGSCSSDLRLKRDIQPFAAMLSKVTALRPVQFYWRSEEHPEYAFGSGPANGLIAQEVEQIFPELVQTDERGFKTVNYAELPLLLLQAVRELKAENDALRGQAASLASVEELAAQVRALQEELKRLKQQP